MAYELTGQGPNVVLLHGFSLDLRMWDEQIPALRDRFQVLRFDARGFGRSELPEDGVPFSPSEDLRALLMALEIPKAHLVGFSAGGALALNFAMEYPGMVDRVVLVDSSLDGFGWSREFAESMGRIDEVARTEGVEAARNLWLAHPLFAAARERPEIAHRVEGIVRGYSGWHWLHENMAQGLDPPAAERLASVRNPTLVLVGERDLPDFRGIARLIAQGVHRAQEEVVPRVGHMLTLESPHLFNRSVLDFL